MAAGVETPAEASQLALDWAWLVQIPMLARPMSATSVTEAPAAQAAGPKADLELAEAHPERVLWRTAGFQLTSLSSMQIWHRLDRALAETPLEATAALAVPAEMALSQIPG